MSDYYKCAWCGKTFEKSAGAKFFSGASMGLSNVGKKYCSKSCEHASKEVKDGPKGSSSKDSEFPKGANQSGETTVIQKGDGFFTAGVKTVGGLYGQLLDRTDEIDAEKRVEGKIDDISQITFGTTVDEISNQLNQLSTLGSAQPDKKLKAAIVDKMEYGIMKLRGLNAIAEADFFQKKVDPLKKKSWF